VIRLAIIADPHLHDCGWRPAGSGLPGAIRSYADTCASTRVFNESQPAFRAALDRAVAEGARMLLLVGDLTDDGQAPNIDAALTLLRGYQERHGLRVFATPGNHDFYALAGRPQVKGFLDAAGGRVTVSSAQASDAATLGTAAALKQIGGLGYLPQEGDLLWETPFGTNPDWAARHYAVPSPDGATVCPMIDASYLVEPVAGLWLLSIDANVCVPRDGATDFSDPNAFHDPTSTGWAAVPQHRAHLLGWIAGVAQRAKAAGKTLVSFSHYPLLDPLGGASAAEVALFGAKGLARRAPAPELARAFAATGVGLHFSGHLHVNDTARFAGPEGAFFNIATPSPVGFPPAMKLAELRGAEISLRTLSLAEVPGHDLAFASYRAEALSAGEAVPQAVMAARHGDFMNCHLSAVVQGRYMAREWPPAMAAFVMAHRLADLLRLLRVDIADTPDMPLLDLVEDWYRLRKGGAVAEPYIPPARLRLYRRLCAALPEDPAPGLAADFCAFLRIMQAYLTRLPNGDFSICLRTGTIVAA
jgi:3',5'-cyclic AMP phosphodiesterase CpdA